MRADLSQHVQNCDWFMIKIEIRLRILNFYKISIMSLSTICVMWVDGHTYGCPADISIWLTCARHIVKFSLTHWGRVMHKYVSKLNIFGSNNGMPPGRHEAIILTNAGILLTGPLGTNFSEILIKIHTFSFKKMHLKTSFGKWRPSCLSLNVLKSSSH